MRIWFESLLRSSPQPNFDFLTFEVKPSAEFWLFYFWGQALGRILTVLLVEVTPSAEFLLFWLLRSSPQPNFGFFDFWGQALSRILTFLTFEVEPSAKFWLFWLLRSSPQPNFGFFDFWGQALAGFWLFWLLRSNRQPKIDFFDFWGQDLSRKSTFFDVWGRDLSRILTFLTFEVKLSAEHPLFWLLRSRPQPEMAVKNSKILSVTTKLIIQIYFENDSSVSLKKNFLSRSNQSSACYQTAASVRRPVIK